MQDIINIPYKFFKRITYCKASDNFFDFINLELLHFGAFK